MASSILARLRKRNSTSKSSSTPPTKSQLQLHDNAHQPQTPFNLTTHLSLQKHLYPPPPLTLSTPLLYILNNAQDAQFTSGSLIKRPVRASLHHQSLELPFAYPIGITLFPTPYPRELFEHATGELREVYDELYGRVSCDERWLREVTRDLARVDALAGVLWGCFERAMVMRESCMSKGLQEEVGLGIWRSDYMMEGRGGSEEILLKQVEMNTLSCAGGLHSNRVSNIHRYLALSGAYDYDTDGSKVPDFRLESLPENGTLMGITKAIAKAHEYYVSNIYRAESSAVPPRICVLMPVQPFNINVADERPIEYELLKRLPSVPCFRLEWQEILNRCQLGTEGRLLFTPLSASSMTWEVSVVYFRASHDLHEYFDCNRVVSVESSGARARILLEASRAIKAPTLLGHIATFKVVQQALTKPGAVELFVSEDKARVIRRTFAEICEMKDDRAKQVIADQEEVKNWIMKPSLEGGGHGIFGDAIPAFTNKLGEKERNKYILMRKIEPPRMRNRLMSSRGMYEGGVISELGVFGACLWRRTSSSGGCDLVFSQSAGCSLKTKADHIDEMSVVKGYGCFDSPLLVDEATFWAISRSS